MQEQVQRHHSEGRPTIHTLGNLGCYAPKSMSKVRATSCAPSAYAPITHLVSRLSHVQTWRLSQTPSHFVDQLDAVVVYEKWQIYSSGEVVEMDSRSMIGHLDVTCSQTLDPCDELSDYHILAYSACERRCL